MAAEIEKKNTIRSFKIAIGLELEKWVGKCTNNPSSVSPLLFGYFYIYTEMKMLSFKGYVIFSTA